MGNCMCKDHKLSEPDRAVLTKWTPADKDTEVLVKMHDPFLIGEKREDCTLIRK